jgi:hypothetical protein
MFYKKILIQIIRFFCCAIFCVVVSACNKDDVRPNYAPPMQYSPVQPYYPQDYRPSSRYYSNPYNNYPPQQYYQYYDYDQYYVPPRAYQGREENYLGRSSTYTPKGSGSYEKY